VLAPAVEARGITKRFPGALACDKVDFALRHGEIHGLLGENGAGKTTLMNILSGLVRPDGGDVAFDGEPARLAGPQDAIAHGVAMVHQHFMLVPPLTVTENIMLGRESSRPAARLLGLLAPLDRKAAAERIRELSGRHGLEIDPAARVEELSVGARQRVEILKALYRNAGILVLDEPTAVLTPQEADDLSRVMRGLAGAGTSIVFITHKLREVRDVADRISVMRAGRMVGTTTPAESPPERLAEMMVGRAVAPRAAKAPARPGDVVLRVAAAVVREARHEPSVRGVSLEVHAGEILGIAGVLGNGQRELVEAIVGLRGIASGTVTLLGEDISHATPRRIIQRGVAHVPEDRHRHGLVLSFPVRDNLVLCTYAAAPFARGWELDQQRIDREAEALVREYDVRTPSIHTLAGALSGGNQQKLVIARELDRAVRLLVVNQPTRGLDVGAVEFIHRRIIAARDRGVAVLLVCADLDEVLSLSDRIAVLYRGSIVRTLAAAEATREQLGLLMAGGGDGIRA
jgi:simple sugar transport system ATP-binding protein